MNLSKVIKLKTSGGAEEGSYANDFMPFASLWAADGGENAGLDPEKVFKTQLAEVEAKAAAIIDAARAEADNIRESAHQEGLASGEKVGREGVAAEFAKAIDAIKAVLANLQEKCLQVDQHIDGDIYELIKTMVDRLVNHEVSVNPKVIQATLAKALDFVVENCTVKVSLHPNDFSRLKDAGLADPHLLEGRNRIQLMEDPSVDEGGCRLATNFGEVDASLNNRRQLLYQVVDQAFMDSLADDIPTERMAPEIDGEDDFGGDDSEL